MQDQGMNRAVKASDVHGAPPANNEHPEPDALLAAAAAVVDAIDTDELHEGGLLSRRTLLLTGVFRRAIGQMRWRA